MKKTEKEMKVFFDTILNTIANSGMAFTAGEMPKVKIECYVNSEGEITQDKNDVKVEFEFTLDPVNLKRLFYKGEQ